MAEKLKLNEILAAIDLNGKEAWDELTEEQRKSVVFFTLNRYVSNVNGGTDLQAHYLLNVNERFNKNLFLFLSKHPKLCWQLICSCAHESKSVKFHPWMKVKKEKNKREEALAKLFPEKKLDDIATLARITSDKEIKAYCKELGWEKKQIDGLKL